MHKYIKSITLLSLINTRKIHRERERRWQQLTRWRGWGERFMLVCSIFLSTLVVFLQFVSSFTFCYVTASFSASLPLSLSPTTALSPSLTTSLSLFLSLLPWKKKRRSRNKAINKKSTAFSVPPHYRLLMYAFCSSITHRPQINALIFPPARLISVAVTTARGSCRTDLWTVGRFTYIY